MDVLFFQQHLEDAHACVRRRRGLMVGFESCRDQVWREEQSLIWLLHTLVQVDVQAPKPLLVDEVQIHCLRLLLSDDPRRQRSGLKQAMECFSHGFDRAQGAFAALELVRPSFLQKYWMDCFKRYAAAQDSLFDLACRLHLAISPSLLRTALLCDDMDLHAAAWRYAASDPKSSLALFEMSDGQWMQEECLETLAARIWGGMLRGRQQAYEQLTLTLECYKETTDELFLELAAFSGHELALEPLMALSDRCPMFATHALAMIGTQGALSCLLELLKKPRTSRSAASAWVWLTGRTLSFCSHLRVAGEAVRIQSDGLAVDVEQAQRQAKELLAGWGEPKQRYIGGQPLTIASVAKLGARSAGRRAQWLWCLLAYLRQKPSQELGHGWLSPPTLWSMDNRAA